MPATFQRLMHLMHMGYALADLWIFVVFSMRPTPTVKSELRVLPEGNSFFYCLELLGPIIDGDVPSVQWAPVCPNGSGIRVLLSSFQGLLRFTSIWKEII